VNALFDLDGTLVWAFAGLIVVGVVFPYVFAFRRRRRLDRLRLAEARELGIDRPVAQFPFIDPMTCIGCGACARACPEGEVLGVVGGVAVVVNGLRCVGHGRCADACPVGAIEVGLGDLRGRRDVPLLTPDLESTVPGLFVAGELTGLALIRNAIEQGERVANTIADRLAGAPRDDDPDAVDLVIVGAGPAGLAAALTAAGRGLRFRVVDQGSGLGGTILQFPARKLVLTRPVALPGGGALEREEYAKEELLEILGRALAAHQVRVRYGEKLERIERDAGQLLVRTSAGVHRGRCVLLALGRRGTPRRLGVPGEELPKVLHQLRDADSYRGRRILVVGGGDSAIEAATGLARQPGNRVTLSYRKQGFHRVKRKNQEAIDTMIRRGKVRVAFGSEVESIESGAVTLRFDDRTERIDNDHVFVLIGGEPPFELLRRCGLAFGGDREGEGGERRRGGIAAALLLAGLLASGAPAVAQQSPHGDLAITCDQCHTTAGWVVTRDAPFRHESTGFRLEGMHAVAACTECHREKVFSRVATACSDCHRDPHLGELGLACSDCHDTRRWDPRSEFFSQHSRTVFPLLGGHARVDCEACHGGQPPEQFALTPTDCVACHRADFAAATDPSHEGFPTDCRQCHSGVAVNWNAPGFAHTALFPLAGAHAGLACADCHTAGTRARADCASCHRDDYDRTRDPNHAAGGFPLTCQACHSTAAWEPASFDHALTGFPLTGEHRSIACADCHTSGYAGTPRNCVSCHRDDYDRTRDPNHAAGGFPTACQNCHSTSGWDEAAFDHASSSFPLTGAHTSVACADCHTSGYSGTPRDCVACHRADYQATRDPNHSVAGFPTTCQTCHSTRSWDAASFDHDGQWFPIYSGTHRGTWSSCSTCHVNPSNYRVFECTVCHEHARAEMNDEHSDVANYRYDSGACYACHPDGRD
jgi:thioredoxin reductase/Pyruvate/2-oxoacid:ferredoxin oxidoreductase delta subunit